MKEVMYTYKDAHNKPTVTVYLVKKGRAIARGIALCSSKDHLKQALGEIKARGRAIKDITRKEPDLPINRSEAIRILFEAAAPPFRYKAEYPAKLTPFEQNLFESA